MHSREKLMKYGAYTKASELFDLVVADMALLAPNRVCERLDSHQPASADSIPANNEEGYGRGSRRDYAHFPVIARGSAQEAGGRCWRLRQWIPADTVTALMALCDEIIAILTSSIKSLRSVPVLPR